jgi:ubiquinone/menaquinone biosynthesis C-methylase UbiE
MSDAVERFTTRVDAYVRYRPGYPQEVIKLLKDECRLNKDSVVADVGSGTGKLAELFLKNSNRVFCVEPNAAMRTAAERLLRHYPGFTSTNGSAEKTALEGSSVDLITAGQSFHWFDGRKPREEFERILKPGGFVALIWNDRRLESTPFLREYEQLLLEYGTDYDKVRSENATQSIPEFFAPASFEFRSFDNVQQFDFESLKGRLLSASYTPQPGNPNFEPMIARLRDIFDANQRNDSVTVEYDTKVYYGRLIKT